MKYKVNNKYKQDEASRIAEEIFKPVMQNLITGIGKELLDTEIRAEVGRHTKPEYVKPVMKLILKKAVDKDILASPYLHVRLWRTWRQSRNA